MYADRLLGNLVRSDVEDVLAHVEVRRLAVECPVIAEDQGVVAIAEGLQQDLLLRTHKRGRRVMHGNTLPFVDRQLLFSFFFSFLYIHLCRSYVRSTPVLKH